MAEETYKSSVFWKWVNDHLADDPTRLRLSMRRDADIDYDAAIRQIECRKRFGKKLGATLKAFPEFYFPDTLVGEQSTSDVLAQYHATLLKSSDTVVDLTAGLGIDALHFARVARHVTAVERDISRVDALQYNAAGLNIDNLTVREGDCLALIDELEATVAYIDPARRGDDGSRVFGLADCEPDVTAMLPALKRRFERLVIKASPMLDISKTINDIPGVTDIYVVGTTTECKELLIAVNLKENRTEPVAIHAVTLTPDSRTVEYTFVQQSEPGTPAATHDNLSSMLRILASALLYEPYPATMKVAPFGQLAQAFGLSKFHANTHLYYGPKTEARADFPGEIFDIVEVVPWQSKNIKRFKNRYPNVAVTVRNFGMTAEALRSKLGVREGGKDQLRLFGVGLGRDHTDRLLIVAKKIEGDV